MREDTIIYECVIYGIDVAPVRLFGRTGSTGRISVFTELLPISDVAGRSKLGAVENATTIFYVGKFVRSF